MVTAWLGGVTGTHLEILYGRGLLGALAEHRPLQGVAPTGFQDVIERTEIWKGKARSRVGISGRGSKCTPQLFPLSTRAWQLLFPSAETGEGGQPNLPLGGRHKKAGVPYAPCGRQGRAGPKPREDVRPPSHGQGLRVCPSQITASAPGGSRRGLCGVQRGAGGLIHNIKVIAAPGPYTQNGHEGQVRHVSLNTAFSKQNRICKASF